MRHRPEIRPLSGQNRLDARRFKAAISILAFALLYLTIALGAGEAGRAFAQQLAPLASPAQIGSTPAAEASSASPVAVSSVIAASPLASTARSSTVEPVSTPASAPKPSAQASPAAPRPHVESPTNPQTVISYLSSVISWYRHLGVEAQLVNEPSETLFFADSRGTANEVVNLAFAYARAQADFIAKTRADNPGSGTTVSQPLTDELSALKQKSDAADAEVATLQARLKDLQLQLAKASARQRDAINTAIGAVRSELDLAQARADAIKAVLQFRGGTSQPDQNGGLLGQIDELEKSIPDTERNPKRQTSASATTNNTSAAPVPLSGQPITASSAAAVEAPAEASGIFGLTSDIFAQQRKIDTLDQTIAITRDLETRVSNVRDPLLKLLSGIEQRGSQLAQGNVAADVATLRSRKQAFANLLEEHKLVAASSLPLSKQLILLGVYRSNLGRWRAAVEQRSSSEIRGLVIRLAGLIGTFVLIFSGAVAWRRLTNRYVQDPRRRGQAMAARRLVMGLLVVFVLLFNFSTELGSAATILGFAAAGIAVALQNVILSIAGYFFLIGRFGIKAGDRVQIGGVTGDVVYIGLVRLSLLELGGSGAHRQPTGRVVIFSNAIVFQPNGNFFKQAPGTSFIWNEVRLTLAPDCDYRLAEKRLLDAVNEVFARYRDRVLSDYRHLERELNMPLETPRPQSRMTLGQAGLEVILRYPAEMRTAPQITDEVSRRVLDAINREPSLRLAMNGTANIQAQTPPPAPSDDVPANDASPSEVPAEK